MTYSLERRRRYIRSISFAHYVHIVRFFRENNDLFRHPKYEGYPHFKIKTLYSLHTKKKVILDKVWTKYWEYKS